MFNKATLFIVITLLTTSVLFGNDPVCVQPDNNVSVTGTTIGNHIEWKASDNVEVAFYIIQRSYDGANFHTVAMINKNSSNQDYTFLDQKSNPTTTYYRILNVNSQGEGHYSKIIEIQPLNISAK